MLTNHLRVSIYSCSLVRLPIVLSPARYPVLNLPTLVANSIVAVTALTSGLRVDASPSMSLPLGSFCPDQPPNKYGKSPHQRGGKALEADQSSGERPTVNLARLDVARAVGFQSRTPHKSVRVHQAERTLPSLVCHTGMLLLHFCVF